MCLRITVSVPGCLEDPLDRICDNVFHCCLEDHTNSNWKKKSFGHDMRYVGKASSEHIDCGQETETQKKNETDKFVVIGNFYGYLPLKSLWWVSTEEQFSNYQSLSEALCIWIVVPSSHYQDNWWISWLYRKLCSLVFSVSCNSTTFLRDLYISSLSYSHFYPYTQNLLGCSRSCPTAELPIL